MPTTPLATAAPWADFHPAVAGWFRAAFPAGPTPAQLRAWPLIRAGRPTLVAAPTGSGKSLAAFLAVIDELVRARAAGALPDATTVLYVSPLKALSNDIRLNLQAPLEGIARELARLGLPAHGIRAAGHGDGTRRLVLQRQWVDIVDVIAKPAHRAVVDLPHVALDLAVILPAIADLGGNV